jgi:thymidylate synthase
VHLKAGTIDDLLRLVMERLDSHGLRIVPGKGDATELIGVLLELTNPRARLSQTEDRGKMQSCLGELLWYLSKRDDLAFMEYYISDYGKRVESHEGRVFGAYGPRLFDLLGVGPLRRAYEKLSGKPHSRRAIVTILAPADLVEEHAEIPCTCTFQFFLRDSVLDMVTTMRSNDVYKGLTHDIFAFTMFHEIAARGLGVEIGKYKHFVGSLHLYDADRAGVEQFLREGFQSTMSAMPPMPTGDPWPSISLVLEAERELRERGSFAEGKYEELDPYWSDLVRLLQVTRMRRAKEIDEVHRLRDLMAFQGFRAYADDVLYGMEQDRDRLDEIQREGT